MPFELPEADRENPSAWLTSAVFGTADLLLLRDRIRREEQALGEEDSYRASFVNK